MGKQRTPQGRSTGRQTPSNASSPPNTSLPNPTLADIVQSVALDASLHPAEDALAPVLPASAPEPLHARLMDTVSPEALGAVATTPASHAPAEAMPVPADANVAEAGPAEPKPAESDPAEVSEPETPTASVAEAADPVPAPVEAAPVAMRDPMPEAPAAYTNVVPLKVVAPARPPEPTAAVESGEAPVQLSDGALPAPASWRAGRRPVPPLRQDLDGLGETLFAFVRDESSAALTHLAALKDARTPADAVRLQVNEIQRVADASLTCWSELARRATRIVTQR